MSIGLLIVALLALFALTGNRRASLSLQLLFWLFIGGVLLLVVGIAISVW